METDIFFVTKKGFLVENFNGMAFGRLNDVKLIIKYMWNRKSTRISMHATFDSGDKKVLKVHSLCQINDDNWDIWPLSLASTDYDYDNAVL